MHWCETASDDMHRREYEKYILHNSWRATAVHTLPALLWYGYGTKRSGTLQPYLVLYGLSCVSDAVVAEERVDLQSLICPR